MNALRLKESFAAAVLTAAMATEGVAGIAAVVVGVFIVIRVTGLFATCEDVGVDGDLRDHIVAMGASVGVNVRAVRVNNDIAHNASWYPQRWRREGIIELGYAYSLTNRHLLESVVWHELGHGRQHVRGAHSIWLAARVAVIAAAATAFDVGAAVVVGVLAVGAVDAVAALHSRRSEHGADRFAARQLGRRDVLAGLTHSNPTLWEQLWSTHPTLQQRRRHLAQRVGHLPCPATAGSTSRPIGRLRRLQGATPGRPLSLSSSARRTGRTAPPEPPAPGSDC